MESNIDELPLIMGNHVHKGIRYPNSVLPSTIDAMETFEVRPDDIFVNTYPKSGTHWIMEIIGLILADGYPDKIDRTLWSSCIEMINIGINKLPKTRAEELTNPINMTPFLDVVVKAPSPRVIQTHLRFKLLPTNLLKRAKVVYLARNPKDVVNSYFNFIGNTRAFDNAPYDKVAEAFMEEQNFRWGSWFDHVMAAWKLRDEENILFMFYEDMQKEPVKSIEQVAKFLGRPLSEETLQRVLEHSSFKGMSQTYRKAAEEAAKSGGIDFTAPSFLKKGTSGQWKSRFTVTLNETFDRWYQKKVKGADIKFDFE
ncbi:sulfotransferase 1A1 [Strongylocentrotus purpuratus]|uniref:Sulfotransferase domain-containing protein n=1 Tax=Strongylocentrotus purpuratus TaxID=7668 RepID=A0A7M7RD60_STRPU|nr:sulfotransferase 1A1 [Strongylocentrotus purpuratus]